MNKTIILLLILAPIYASSQVDWQNPKGAIKSEEIIIEKDKQLILPSVSRRFSSIAVEALVLDTMAINYTPKDIPIELTKIPIRLRPRTMKTEALDKTYWGNFKLGYGSYLSPLVQADVASKRNDEYAVAAHFRHFSSKNGPVDGNNSGLSNTNAYLSGKLFLNNVTIGGNLGASFDKYHLYGYNSSIMIPEANTIEQKLSNYILNFRVTDNDTKTDFYYQANFGAHFFNANSLLWKENDMFANLSLDFNLVENIKIKTLSELHFSTQNSTTNTNSRVYFKVKPYAVYSMDAFNFEVGAGIYSIKDSINGYKNKLYITPHLVARYSLASGQMVSAGVRGDVSWQTARTQFATNPYLGISTVVNSEIKPVEAFLEANGKLAPKVDFTLVYNASVYKVFDQFVNNASDQAIFNIDYQQDNNTIHSINGQVDFIALKNLLFSVYGKYLIFSFKNIENAYHTPKVNFGLKAKFNLENKFDAEFSLAYLDGIYAFDNASSLDIQLDAILDMNISASYKINSTFSAFVKMQNILGNQYQYFYHYSSKGFQAMGGISLTL